VAVPPELVRSSKSLFDVYRTRAVLAMTTVDAIIGGSPLARHTFRLLAFMVPDRSLTIRLEHGSDGGVLRVSCSPPVEGMVMVEQAGDVGVAQPLMDGSATFHGVEAAWTTVVVRPDRSDFEPVQTAWTLL
jgi:hypothetical protein